MDSLFIFCGQYLYLLVFLIAFWFFIKQPLQTKINIVFIGFFCALLSYLVALLAGHLYYNPRPFVEGHFTPLIAHDTENGFPSDHVLMISVISIVIFIFNKGYGALTFLVTLIVAYARVYVGVHHYIDVVASILITWVVTFLFYLIYQRHLFDKFLGNIYTRLKNFEEKNNLFNR